MASFIDLLVFPSNLEYEFSDREKVCVLSAGVCGAKSAESGGQRLLALLRSIARLGLVGRLFAIARSVFYSWLFLSGASENLINGFGTKLVIYGVQSCSVLVS